VKLDLSGKTAPVTGPTRGIGPAIATGRAREGARVAGDSPYASATTGAAVRVDGGYVDSIRS
jgi:NAD(P)-dependent dehydrogenase (short-subunit alcohol dehydrogenase family)